MPGTENRRAKVAVRLTPRAKIRLRAEADRQGTSMSSLIETLIPTPRYPVGECRYCKKLVRQPGQRHRHHELACALYADKGFRE